MEKLLRYDMMLEVDGVLRSQDVRVELDREVQPGETINVHDRDWLVTAVTAAKPNHGARSSPHRARGRERGSVREDLALGLLGLVLIGLAFLIG